MGLSDSEKILMICSAVLIQYTAYTPMTDRRTDRQTDGQVELPWHIHTYAIVRKNPHQLADCTMY